MYSWWRSIWGDSIRKEWQWGVCQSRHCEGIWLCVLEGNQNDNGSNAIFSGLHQYDLEMHHDGIIFTIGGRQIHKQIHKQERTTASKWPSPLIFNLLTENLFQFFHLVERKGQLDTYKIVRTKLVTHLLFVDDVLYFTKANRKSMEAIK